MAKLLEEVHNVARLKHLNRSAERAYAYYIKQFILFHQKRHSLEMGSAEIRAFLTHAVKALTYEYAASTQESDGGVFVFQHTGVR